MHLASGSFTTEDHYILISVAGNRIRLKGNFNNKIKQQIDTHIFVILNLFFVSKGPKNKDFLKLTKCLVGFVPWDLDP